jgi:hypothetical protein
MCSRYTYNKDEAKLHCVTGFWSMAHAARVVPGHFGKDWPAALGNGVIRMMKETQQSQGNTENYGGGVFAWS